MKYFSIEIKAFLADVAYLTYVQRTLYENALFYYYESEAPLQKKDLPLIARRIGANTPELYEQFLIMLEQFFIDEETQYRHARCDREIARYKAKHERFSEMGKKSGAARKRKKTENKQTKNCANPPQKNAIEPTLNLRSTYVEPMLNNLLFVNCFKSFTEFKTFKNIRPEFFKLPTPAGKLTNEKVAQKTRKNKKTPPGKKLKPVDPNAERYANLAAWMAEQIRAEFPTQKINLNSWTDCIRKILTLDKKTEAELRTLWIWIRHHNGANFSWAANCRSPLKLRERNDGLPYFDLIQNQMHHERDKANQQKQLSTFEQLTGPGRNDWYEENKNNPDWWKGGVYDER